MLFQKNHVCVFIPKKRKKMFLHDLVFLKNTKNILYILYASWT